MYSFYPNKIVEIIALRRLIEISFIKNVEMYLSASKMKLTRYMMPLR